MHKLLKYLLRFAMQMNIIDGDGGSRGGGAMSTDSFAEMLSGPSEDGQPDTDPDPQTSDPDHAPIVAPDPDAHPDADPDANPDPGADPAPDPD